jgi:hypothetical protein
MALEQRGSGAGSALAGIGCGGCGLLSFAGQFLSEGSSVVASANADTLQNRQIQSKAIRNSESICLSVSVKTPIVRIVGYKRGGRQVVTPAALEVEKDTPMLPCDRAEGNPPAPAHVPFWRHALACCTEALELAGDCEIPEWSAIFTLVREIRGHEDAVNHKPTMLALRLYRECPDLELFGGHEDFAQQFASSWEKIRTLPGEDLLASALRLADATPLGLDKKHAADVTAGYKRFVSFAGWLCVAAGTDCIKLPCREVAAVLGVRPMTVSCYRQQAVAHGYLIPLKKHVYRPNGKGEATLFRFRVEWYECLRTKVAPSE